MSCNNESLLLVFPSLPTYITQDNRLNIFRHMTNSDSTHLEITELSVVPLAPYSHTCTRVIIFKSLNIVWNNTMYYKYIYISRENETQCIGIVCNSFDSCFYQWYLVCQSTVSNEESNCILYISSARCAKAEKKNMFSFDIDCSEEMYVNATTHNDERIRAVNS